MYLELSQHVFIFVIFQTRRDIKCPLIYEIHSIYLLCHQLGWKCQHQVHSRIQHCSFHLVQTVLGQHSTFPENIPIALRCLVDNSNQADTGRLAERPGAVQIRHPFCNTTRGHKVQLGRTILASRNMNYKQTVKLENIRKQFVIVVDSIILSFTGLQYHIVYLKLSFRHQIKT